MHVHVYPGRGEYTCGEGKGEKLLPLSPSSLPHPRPPEEKYTCLTRLRKSQQ